MTKLLLCLCIIYGSVLLLLFLFQRSFIYHPSALDRQFRFPRYVPGLEEVTIRCDDGCVISGLYAPGSGDRSTVLIFHGNAGNITHRDFLLREFSRTGHAMLLIDYHGYGKSEGTPTEQNLYLDAEASLRWLVKQKNVGPEQVVLYGESLGCGVAIECATRHECMGVILASPFTSIAAVARHHFPFNCFPVSIVLKDRFDNQAKIARVRSPVLILHGTADEIVAAEHSKVLYETAHHPKQIQLFEGADHNRLPFDDPGRYWSIIGEWLEQVDRITEQKR